MQRWIVSVWSEVQRCYVPLVCCFDGEVNAAQVTLFGLGHRRMQVEPEKN